MKQDDSLPFRQVAVMGPGLMGGSLLMALRQRFPAVRLQVWARRAASLQLAAPWADRTSLEPAEAVSGCDLVVLCTPVETMAGLAQRMRDGLGENALVTDVGSVKTGVIEPVAAALGAGGHFTSSHPMAGSEKDGFEAAHADLYEGAPCILTPVLGETESSRIALERFWQNLGMRTCWMEGEDHDRAVATVSHLPHIAASALVREVMESGPETLAVAGSGWRDTTRVASGSAKLWTEILAANRVAVSNALEQFACRLLQTARHLRQGDSDRIHAFLEEAREARDSAVNHF